MKIPKVVRTYCPKCRIHTEHSVSIYKKGKERSMSWGARKHEEDKKGYGCLLYTSPSPRDLSTSRMPSSA